MEIKILKNILDRNQNMAGIVRERLKESKTLMVNIISSPGSGKTSLLEKTCEALAGRYRIGIIEGDVSTDRDARRLQKYNIPVVQINTGRGCHLDSHSISKALESFDTGNIDVIFVENVGNLICPTQFDLGESFKLALLSTAEGDDKPAKYPMLFREAEAVILNKTDLIPYTNFRTGFFRNDLVRLNGRLRLFELSCTSGKGLPEWFDWISGRIDCVIE